MKFILKSNLFINSTRILSLIALMFLFSFCGKNPADQPTPKGIIPDEILIKILVEVHMADAAFIVADIRPTNKQSFGYYNYIYKKHNVTKEQFQKTLTYYSSNPEKLSLIYDEVLNELSKKEGMYSVQ